MSLSLTQRLSRPARHAITGTTFAFAAGIVLVAAAIFARLMAYPLGRDEQMFVSAGVLVGQNHLYRDLGFNHLPNLPLLYHLLFGLIGTTHHLLVARLVTAGAWVVLCTSIGMMAYRASESRLVTAVVLLLLAADPLLLGQAGMMATNSLLPLSFLVLGFWLFMAGLAPSQPKPLLLLLSGAALAFAAGCKINFGLPIPAFVIALLFVQRELPLTRRLREIVLPFAIGGLIGATPTLWYLATDPQGLLSHALGYHLGPHRAYWRAAADAGIVTSLFGKVQLGIMIWFAAVPSLAMLTGLVAVLAVIDADGFRAGLRRFLVWPVFLALGVLVIGVAAALVPTPSFPQYFIIPPVAITILVALGYGRLEAEQVARCRLALRAIALILLLIGAPRWLQDLPGLANVRHWASTAVHRDGLDIAAAMRDAGVDGKVATLAPIIPLEAGLQIYPEFASGPFVYRVGDYLSAAARPLYRTTSPSQVDAFLSADPPAAILTGFEGALEQPFVDFAERHGYRRYQSTRDDAFEGRGVLYLRSMGGGG